MLAKAVVHHVMSASGLDVPRRELALARARPLDAWASGARGGGEARRWLKTRLHEVNPASPAARTIVRALFNERPPEDVTLAATFDIAA